MTLILNAPLGSRILTFVCSILVIVIGSLCSCMCTGRRSINEIAEQIYGNLRKEQARQKRLSEQRERQLRRRAGGAKDDTKKEDDEKTDGDNDDEDEVNSADEKPGDDDEDDNCYKVDSEEECERDEFNFDEFRERCKRRRTSHASGDALFVLSSGGIL